MLLLLSQVKNILLIEDDLDIQKVYFEKLSSAGYQVFLASNSTQGLQIVKNEKLGLILLDIMLPGKINGLELLEIFKKDKALKAIPVIILTNLKTKKDSALKIGAIDYLLKADTDLNTLVEKVETNIV
jgi:DNA-binding response OmpR family regulator